jgi:hypothetical protein
MFNNISKINLNVMVYMYGHCFFYTFSINKKFKRQNENDRLSPMHGGRV